MNPENLLTNQNNLVYNYILVVDDKPENLRLLSDSLKHKGYEVRCVRNGKRALQVVELDPPDLILLDIKMPEMDGYEVCKILKANAKYQDIPIIFLSAYNETIDKVKAFESGGVDYLTKPFQIVEVMARINTQLNLRKYQKELKNQNLFLEEINQALEENITEKSKHMLDQENQWLQLRDFFHNNLVKQKKFNAFNSQMLSILGKLYQNNLNQIYQSLNQLTQTANPEQIILLNKLKNMTLELIENAADINFVVKKKSKEKATINIIKLLDYFVNNLKEKNKDKLAFVTGYSSKQEIWIEGNETNLKFVLKQLINQDWLEEETKVVRIETVRDNDFLKIIIKYEGTNLPEDSKKRLTSLFVGNLIQFNTLNEREMKLALGKKSIEDYANKFVFMSNENNVAFNIIVRL